MEPPSQHYNATVDLLERNLVSGKGGRPYLLTDSKAISFDEVAAAADSIGAGLLGLGLERGDRVLVLTQDCPELVCTFWGAMKAGVVPVLVSPGLSAADVRFIVKDSKARALVFDSSTERFLSAIDLVGITLLSLHAAALAGARRWGEVVGHERLAAAPTRPEDTAFWLYTSGTTGTPKAVLHPHRNLRAAPDGLSRQVIGLGTGDIVLSASRMSFAYGLGNSVYLPAAAGASVVVDNFPVSPSSIQRLIDRYSPTILFGVSSFYSGYVQLPEANLTPSVRQAHSAGEALSTDLFQRFKDRFGRPLLDGLGSTEMMHHVTANRVEDAMPGSAGRPLNGFEIEVRDPEGRALGEGASGELWLRGPTISSGYWNRPELTARNFVDSWLRTGDRVQVRDGRLYHQGRFDDLMKLGGIWVAPGEIEGILRAHPDVTDAAVVLTNNDAGLPVLKAFVRSARADVGLHVELAAGCRARLASFKVPRAFETVSDLPRTPTGKLWRFELRRRRG
jgi:benzoate-CoA ligase family protein